MTTTKRKVSVSLDDDLVTALEASDEALSVQVNEAIRVEVDRRRRQEALGALLARLAPNCTAAPVEVSGSSLSSRARRERSSCATPTARWHGWSGLCS